MSSQETYRSPCRPGTAAPGTRPYFDRVEPVRLLVFSGNNLWREALALALARERDIDQPGQAGNGSQALAMCRADEWHVVLIAAPSSDLLALHLQAALQQEFPGLAVIWLWMPPLAGTHGSTKSPGQTLTCECTVDDLLAVIRVAAGRRANKKSVDGLEARLEATAAEDGGAASYRVAR